MLGHFELAKGAKYHWTLKLSLFGTPKLATFILALQLLLDIPEVSYNDT